MMTAAVKLPNELFKIIIETEILKGQHLKSIRLVCHALKDFSTPLLFREISFSVTKENLEAFTSITGNRSLNKHVKMIAVDATRPVPLNPKLHILEAARNCDLWLNLLCQCGNLRDDIECALIEAAVPVFTSDFGSMAVQSAFIPGFALHQARAEFWGDTVARDGIFSTLVKGFLKFENLTSVSLTTKWSKNEKRLEAAWESKGKSTLRSLIDIIKVLSSSAAQQTRPVETGYFSGPGISARNLEFFHPFPRASPYSIQTTMRALCRALATCHKPLECLVLPQDWELGEDVDIPLESFFSYHGKKPPTLSNFKTTFSQLRYLDLHIDTSVARAGVGWNGDLLDTGSFSSTIRCMHQIQTLRLDFVSNNIFGLNGLEIGIQEAFGIFEIERLLDTFSNSDATAVIPNPWPNLKHLTLCGISSMWEEYLILFNTISSTLSTLDLQEARVSRGLKLAVEWANLVSGMRRQFSNLKTLTLRPEAADEWTLMAELKHLTGEELQEGSLGEEMEEHILHGAKNPLYFWLLDDDGAKREGEEVEWDDD